jgi:hypothetical protein
MVQRSTPQQALAEPYFPVRMRVAVPPGGFGNQFNVMCAWLDQHAGKGGYFAGAQAGAGLQDAALFYFVEADMAAAFVDRFACGLIVAVKRPHRHRRRKRCAVPIYPDFDSTWIQGVAFR